MPETPPSLTPAQKILRLGAIALVVAAAAGAFAYVNGTLDPARITPDRLVDGLEKNNGLHPGYRRNHAKGACVIGYFEPTDQARPFSKATVFSAPRTPVVGRLAIPPGNPYAPDTAAPIRSMGLRFQQADGQQWRTGMNSMPLFPVGTVEAFFQLQQANTPDPATGKPVPGAVQQFFAGHPESAPFLAWVKTAKPSASYITQSYNSVNAFNLVDRAGQRHPVRWSMVPVDPSGAAQPAPDAKDFLEKDLGEQLANAPARWKLMITLAEPGDPTNDASKAWPESRKTLDAGTLVLEKTQPQSDGECRDINYDPLVLPAGIEGSDDPLLAARSAAYASSYLRRTSEVNQLDTAQEKRP